MNNKPTVTIGIPAYNEEANIKRLLHAILVQELKSVIIEKIIVVSDCSTDNTVNEVNSTNDPRVVCIQNQSRSGQAISQNHILEANNSDILVLLNADVLITENFIEQIVQPILHQQADLVGARIQPLSHQTFFEKIINFSVIQKVKLYETINFGNNLYTCCGRGRAFSKKLASQLHWPKLTSEDSFSYLFCIQNRFRYAYVKTACVYYRSPNNFNDHLKQSARFLNSKSEMLKYFDKNIVDKNYKIPTKSLLQILFDYLLKRPLSVVSFFTIYICVIIFYLVRKHTTNPHWSVSTSTKVV